MSVRSLFGSVRQRSAPSFRLLFAGHSFAASSRNNIQQLYKLTQALLFTYSSPALLISITLRRSSITAFILRQALVSPIVSLQRLCTQQLRGRLQFVTITEISWNWIIGVSLESGTATHRSELRERGPASFLRGTVDRSCQVLTSLLTASTSIGLGLSRYYAFGST